MVKGVYPFCRIGSGAQLSPLTDHRPQSKCGRWGIEGSTWLELDVNQ